MPRVVAVVPALDEAERIGAVIRTMPSCVQRIIVIDDGSTDGTSSAVREAIVGGKAGAGALDEGRVELLRNELPRGVGFAIAEGYRRAMQLDADVVVVLAGDGQMHPDDLEPLVAAIVDGRADYAKGNRFDWPNGARIFPWSRLLGVKLFSFATRMATGLDVGDTQCGYTAIGRRALRAIDWTTMWPSYGYPNELLSRLARLGLRVVEVPVRPIYEGEKSKLRLRHLPPIAGLVARAAMQRLAAPKAIASAPDDWPVAEKGATPRSRASSDVQAHHPPTTDADPRAGHAGGARDLPEHSG